MGRLWGKIGDNEVRRRLSKKDIRRLNKGGEVRVKVNGLIVVLVEEGAIHQNQKAIDKIDSKMAKLLAKRSELVLNKEPAVK